MVYDYPSNWSNNSGINGIGNYFQYLNSSTEGILTTGFLFLIWLSTFLLSIQSGARKAFITSGFIGSIFAVWLARLSMVKPVIVIIFIAMLIIGLLMKDEASI